MDGVEDLKRFPYKFKNEQNLNKLKTELKHLLIDKMFIHLYFSISF